MERMPLGGMRAAASVLAGIVLCWMADWSLTAAAPAAGAAAGAPAGPANLAAGARATASSVLEPYAAERAIDGDAAEDASRWVSARTAGPHWLQLDWPAPLEIGSAHIHTGWGEQAPVASLRLEWWDGAAWAQVAGGAARDNAKTALALRFERPVRTSRLRLVSEDAGPVRVKELLLWAPAAGGPPALGTGLARGATGGTPPDPTRHHLRVNQCGYNVGLPKRFTAPLSPDGSRFIVTRAGDDKALFEGTVKGGVGDLSAFEPKDADGEFVVRVSGGGLKEAVSDPFAIAPRLIQRVSLEQAVRFMQDARSVVGTHPSAYGGGAFRDSTYYTFEVPSLVLLYLSDPASFDALAREIDPADEKARVTAPSFKLVKAPHDEKALETARRYYAELEQPAATAPDIVRVIHWGVGFYLLDPETHDPSSDPIGNKVHSQTIEQLAFFLYAYPAFKQHVPEAFYARVRDFAFEQWEKVGLYDVDKAVGDFKGRHCPGHSIMPNLMMAEVAGREGRAAEAARFLDAAVAQAKWVVGSLDPADPMVTKGQRMSEHKLVPALVMLLRQHPDKAPAGLKAWIGRWADVAIARSANMWDFRRFNDELWTIPKRSATGTAGVAGGAGWNEPGNLAGFPAPALAAASVLDDKAKAQRLVEIAVAQLDNVFGRNPVGAHASHDALKWYKGAERGWPKKFPDNVCARLELVRGTINSTCAHEHYPFNPSGDFRHPEGWTAFNAAFNVGLAYLNWHEDGRDGVAKGFGLLRTGASAGR